MDSGEVGVVNGEVPLGGNVTGINVVNSDPAGYTPGVCVSWDGEGGRNNRRDELLLIDTLHSLEPTRPLCRPADPLSPFVQSIGE